MSSSTSSGISISPKCTWRVPVRMNTMPHWTAAYDEVEVEVAGRVAGDAPRRSRRRRRRAGSRACRRARSPPAMSSKTMWAKTSQPRSSSRGPSAGHLPVEDRDRLEVAVHDVADAGVAPAEHGRALVGPVRLEPGEAVLDRAASAWPGRRRTRTSRGCGRRGAAAAVSPGGVERRGSANAPRRRSIAWSPARTPTVASCSRRWSSGAASYSQLSPNVYGMTSGGTTPSTRSITKNGEPITSGSGSSQRTGGTGTSVSSPTSRITSNWWPRS